MTQDVLERIKRAYDDDQKSGRKARARDDIPISYEAITPEWLTAVLCTGLPDAEVVSYSLDVPDDGTSGRRRIFVRYNDAGRTAGLPASVFGKASQELVHRIIYGMNLLYGRESNFYNIARPRLAIETPKAYFANYDAETFNSIVLLEDIGDRAEFCTEHSEIAFAEAQQMVRLLADLHAPFSQPELYGAIEGKIHTLDEHWAAIMGNGMEEGTDRGFLKAESVIPPRLYARASEIWPATLASVARHADLPATLMHGDTHLANWYKTTDGRMGLSDWQGAALGHWSRDLVYALACCLTIENRRAWEGELVRAYLERWTEHGLAQPMSFDEVWTNYRQQSLSALAYWTVTYTPPPGMPENMQPKDRALVFVGRLATAVDDLDALDAF